VDVELRQALWAFVRSLNAAGHTIVLTTHYLEEAQQLCTRIAMMKEGRVVALDTTARLLASFSERVMRVKLEHGELPPAVALRATPEPSGSWRIAIDDMAHAEQVLARLREAGCAVASLEIGEPELEEVFVRIMHAQEPLS
jgi:ABC-2 type transport system ATP-binding protein